MTPNTTPEHAGQKPTAVHETMKVSGEVLNCFPHFILNRYGKEKYRQWNRALSPIAQQTFQTTINKKEWYPLNELLTEPTIILCNMFFNGSLRGAWESGRASADLSLSGIRKLLVKLSKPDVLIERAAGILPNYYKPSALSVVKHEDNMVMLKITEFPEYNLYIEHRIGGWMERALQICGSKHINIQTSSSLSKGDPATEYRITWKKY